jgi:hypothetical protein
LSHREAGGHRLPVHNPDVALRRADELTIARFRGGLRSQSLQRVTRGAMLRPWNFLTQCRCPIWDTCMAPCSASVTYRPVDALLPYDRNARLHSSAGALNRTSSFLLGSNYS